MPSEIIANTVPAALGHDPADDDSEDETTDPAEQRNERQRDRPAVRNHRIHHVAGREAAEAVMHGVTERQQSGLAEQDVVGQREDDRDADQAERRQRAAGGEDQRQDDQRGDADQPDAVEAQAVRPAGFDVEWFARS